MQLSKLICNIGSVSQQSRNGDIAMTPTKYQFDIMVHFANRNPFTVSVEHYLPEWALKIAMSKLPTELQSCAVTVLEIVNEVEL